MTIVRDFAQKATAATSAGITLGTVAATTSGTAVDFTGIPTTAKRITIMFSGVSTSGTSGIIVRIGSSSTPVGAGNYFSTAATGASTVSTTAGFPVTISVIAAANTLSGRLVLSLIGSNAWVGSGSTISASGGIPAVIAGNSLALAAALNIVRITTTNGTDTFDAGSVNIAWE